MCDSRQAAISVSRPDWDLARPPFSKIRIPLLARRHDLWVDLRQDLRGLLPLRRPEHNRPNTIYCHPKTHLGTVVSKARPCTCRRDQGAGVPGHGLGGCGVSGRKLSRLCQHNDQTNQRQRSGRYAHDYPKLPGWPVLPAMRKILPASGAVTRAALPSD
jgi:hypothetical protein